MISDFPVVVDACVPVQAAVRDTLLRLFERRLFLARWTDEIIDETVRTLRDKLGRTEQETTHLVTELRTHFPDAALKPFGIEPKHPDEFLIDLYHLNGEIAPGMRRILSR